MTREEKEDNDAREEFIAVHLDELIGLLVGAFAQHTKTQHRMAEDAWAGDGRFMIAQMARARNLLGRIYDTATKLPKSPATTEAMVDDLIKRIMTVPFDERTKIADKIRPAFQKDHVNGKHAKPETAKGA